MFHWENRPSGTSFKEAADNPAGGFIRNLAFIFWVQSSGCSKEDFG
jgi:hypothetical protein